MKSRIQQSEISHLGFSRKEIEERHSQHVSNEADPAAIAMWDNWKEGQILSLYWDWDDQGHIETEAF